MLLLSLGKECPLHFENNKKNLTKIDQFDIKNNEMSISLSINLLLNIRQVTGHAIT